MKNKKSCVQKNKQRKKSTRRMRNKVLSSSQISSYSSADSAGRPLTPPLLLLGSSLSLSLPLRHSPSFSPPPLAASRQSSWFTPPCLGLSESCERLLFRSVTADWEQLTQGQGGEERVTLSSASQEPYLHSS